VTSASAADAAISVAKTNEQDIAPGGIVGFSLNYMQISCT
jgi:hypothetical protein